MGGFLPSSDSSLPATDTNDLSLTAMTAGDVPECADLFLAAHGADHGWDKRADMTGMLAAGIPFAM